MLKKKYQGDFTENSEKGAVAAIVAICLVVLIGAAVLAIDIGRIATTKNELQNISDAAALAGTVELRDIYQNDVIPNGIQNFECDTSCIESIRDAARTVAAKNMPVGINIEEILEDNAIRIGRWDSSTSVFSPNTILPTAVEVTAKRDEGNSISLFFAGIFGMSSQDIFSNVSIASITGAASMPEPEVATPFAVSQLMFPDDCTDVVQFRPSASCASWHNFLWPANSDDISTHILGIIYRHLYEGDGLSDDDAELISGKAWIEENFNMNINNFENRLRSLYNVNHVDDINLEPYSVGDEFNFIGGVSSTHFSNHVVDVEGTNGGRIYDGNTSEYALNQAGNIANNPNNPSPMFALYDYFRYRDDDGPDFGDDGDFWDNYEPNEVWTTYTPVYEEYGENIGDCSNPNQSKKIVAFAKVRVIMPKRPPYSEIDVYLSCDIELSEDQGSGITAGNVYGTIPKLVQ